MAVRLAAVKVCGAEPSPQFDHGGAGGGGEVGDGRPLVGVGEGAEQDGAGVVIPSMPVISVPLELESGASSTVAVPGVSMVVTPPEVVTLILTV